MGLDNINQVIKLNAYINATEDDVNLPYVMDGCSNLFLDVFNTTGGHARTTVGVKSLPFNVPIEIDGIFELK